MRNPLDLTKLTVEQLEEIAFSNITDFASFNGCTVRLKSLYEIDPKKLIAIREMSQLNGKTTIKLHDKIAALELLAKHLGLFNDFNLAIATFRKYGINLIQDFDGSWKVEQEMPEINPSQVELA